MGAIRTSHVTHVTHSEIENLWMGNFLDQKAVMEMEGLSFLILIFYLFMWIEIAYQETCS